MLSASCRAVLILFCFDLMAVSTEAVSQEKITFTKPALIEFDGPIFDRSYQFFKRKLAAAKSWGADLLIIQVNSPGGALEESLLIAETLRDVDWALTVAFIPEKALSGAALVSLGCDEIVISQTARIGDAGIVFLDESFAFQYAPEKVITDLVRRARDLAQWKGRSPELAEAMIDMDTIVYQNLNQKDQFETRRATNSGYPHRQVTDDQNAQQAGVERPDEKEWELVEESKEKRFLEVNGKRAIELGLAQKNAGNRDELAAQFDLSSELKIYRETTTDNLVYWLNRPLVVGLLFVVGLIALYLEFTAPGIGIGALIAGLCFLIFFWSQFLGGTATVLEVILFLAGISFLLMEIFVIPGFGVAGLSGMVLLGGSVLMATQDFVIPATDAQWDQFRTNLTVMAGAGCLFLVGAVALSKYLGKVPFVNRLILGPVVKPDPDGEGKDKKPSATPHPVVAVGDWGIAESVLCPSGKARFGDRTVDVVSDGSYIESDQPIKVLEISGNRVLVVKA